MQTCTYSHDDLSRIASGNCGSIWSQTFSYDAFGNISKTGNESFNPGYNYQTNQMNSGASYDANGDVLSDSLHNYAWDVETRPTTIDSVTVTYDALGRMVEQSKSGTNTEIVYDCLGNKLALMNGTSTLVEGFAPLPAGATAVYNASGLHYYRHPDWLGSSRFSSTPSRTMYNDLAYAPFGETYAATSNTGVTNISFAGNNEDTTTNLYDAQFREYGIQGRWPSPDPAGTAAANLANPQSWNRYAYTGNNPLLHVDPLGLTYPNDCGGPCVNFMLIGPDGCLYEVVYFPQTDPQGTVFTGAELVFIGCQSTGGGSMGGGAAGGGSNGNGPGNPNPPPKPQSYADCVKNSGNEASVQGLLGLGNSKVAGAFLGNPFSDAIQFFQNRSAGNAVQLVAADATTEALRGVPNVAVSYSSTTVTASPSEFTVITNEISAYLPLGDIATGATDLLAAFGKTVTIPVSVTATAFGAVVCAAGR